ncbi:MAG: ABC transporter permease [Anaerolineae bacterium]|nr:ABC transporter permease [Anaerolineae bacterium]
MKLSPSRWRDTVVGILIPIGAVAGALLAGVLILVLAGVNPVKAYGPLLIGPFANLYGIAQTITKATPLLLVGLGICIGFRGGVINIGGEGQIVAGALFTTWVGLQLRSLPGIVLIPLLLLTGFIGGALWGAVPGILKARLNASEILSTIMMNLIAAQGVSFLLRGPMIDPAEIAYGTGFPQSEALTEWAWLPRVIPRTTVHLGAIIALVMAVLVYVFLWRTTIGYRVRAVGYSKDASRYAGINVARYAVLAMLLSGGLAGLAGAVEVMGIHHRLLDGVSAGYGFTGIVAGLFGKLHPIGVIPASFLFGALLVGADKMQRAVGVSPGIVYALQGLVVLFVVSSDLWVRRRSARRVEGGGEELVND